jgi:hypothetical protein
MSAEKHHDAFSSMSQISQAAAVATDRGQMKLGSPT